jgi:hypothetical protein
VDLPTYSAGRYTKTEVFELPVHGVNAKQASAALWEYTQKNSLDEFKGVKPIFMHTTEGYVLHSNKLVRTMDDLKGMKDPHRDAHQREDGGRARAPRRCRCRCPRCPTRSPRA